MSPVNVHGVQLVYAMSARVSLSVKSHFDASKSTICRVRSANNFKIITTFTMSAMALSSSPQNGDLKIPLGLLDAS